jgi:hypothetical protein
MFIWTLICKSGAIKVTMNGIIKSMVGFKVYIVEIFGRNLSQILADELEMIKSYFKFPLSKGNSRASPAVLSMRPWRNISHIQVQLFSFFQLGIHKTKTGTPNR